MNRLRALRSSTVIAVLAMTLLFAQMLGFVHGIVHAGWAPGTVHSLISEAFFDEGDNGHAEPAAHSGGVPDHHASHSHAHGLHHSCLAYDAAALSAGMHFDFPALPLLAPDRVLALWLAFASWDAPLNCHFSSRAPPR
ncbi:hypothetical protein HBDW_01670 [Herbaspirillum sp. DW155]|uniref:hypothetical protein n=1 Tax=Herbaspirillum sp. DW155 TaxID=3095609 RepID=UPI0030926465|nr:hypothetical protein HBDW_01670 [Herbaspirillum sp. DW155]